MSATLYLGGTIRTVDPIRPAAEALIVDGKRIVFVGSESDARALIPSGAGIRDLDGACLLPGFVDAHTHPLMLGQCLSWADLSGVADVAVVVDRLRAHAATLPPDAPIRGFGYDQHLLPGGRHPSADLLDRVSGEREVVVMHASGHGYAVNHVALRRAGITSDTPTPLGGLIGRDGNGHLDGRVFDAACDLLTGPGGVKITNHGPNLHLGDDPDVLLAQFLSAQQVLLAAGVTTACDCQVTERELGVYQRARTDGYLTMRLSMMVLSSHLAALETLGLHSGFGDDLLWLGGVKCYADGSLISGTADVPCGCGNYHGHVYHPFDELAELIERAHRAGLQTGTHAQGERSIGVVLDAIEDAQRRTPRPDARHRIEHCGLPSDDQIARMARLGVWPVSQPTQVWQYGAGIRRALGDPAERMYPAGLYHSGGVPVVLSSDTPVTMPDVPRSIHAAVTRQTLDGAMLGADCAIPIDVALAGWTIRAAEVLHRERSIGSLQVGKLADLVLVDHDPTEVDTADLPGVEVVETIVGGRVVWTR